MSSRLILRDHNVRRLEYGFPHVNFAGVLPISERMQLGIIGTDGLSRRKFFGNYDAKKIVAINFQAICSPNGIRFEPNSVKAIPKTRRGMDFTATLDDLDEHELVALNILMKLMNEEWARILAVSKKVLVSSILKGKDFPVAEKLMEVQNLGGRYMHVLCVRGYFDLTPDDFAPENIPEEFKPKTVPKEVSLDVSTDGSVSARPYLKRGTTQYWGDRKGGR